MWSLDYPHFDPWRCLDCIHEKKNIRFYSLIYIAYIWTTQPQFPPKPIHLDNEYFYIWTTWQMFPSIFLFLAPFPNAQIGSAGKSDKCIHFLCRQLLILPKWRVGMAQFIKATPGLHLTKSIFCTFSFQLAGTFQTPNKPGSFPRRRSRTGFAFCKWRHSFDKIPTIYFDFEIYI